MPKYKPLESRTFRYKNPSMEFFCPLCGTQRAIVTAPRLSAKNYLQMILLTTMTTMALWNVMNWRSVFFFFFYWALFEGTRRSMFRKEVPCPHCGFDASWYKRDVKMAKQLVHNFWESRTPQAEESESDSAAQNINP